MKCLQLFKNRTGAISGVRAGVLALMVASVGFSISSYFGGGETTSQSPQVRNLAAIMSQGGQLPVQYASIATSFTKGNLQFATAKEKAEMEGTALFDSEEAVDRLESYDVVGQTFGGGEAGLGFRNDVKEIEGGAGGTRSGTYGDVKGVDGVGPEGQPGNGTGTRGSGQRVNQLSHATVARATGGNYNTASYGSPTGGSGGNGSATRPSAFSGSMPTGSSSYVRTPQALQGAHGGGYRMSEKDKAKLHKLNPQTVNEEGNEVKRLAVRSHQAAATDGPANKGALVFLTDKGATYTVNAVDTKSSTGETRSASSGLRRLRQNNDTEDENLDDAVDPEVEYTAAKDAAESHLKEMTIALLLTVIAFFPLLCTLSSGEGWMRIAGAVLGAALLGMCVTLMVTAFRANGAYDDFDNWRFASALLAGGGLGGLVTWATLNGMFAKEAGKKFFAKMMKNLGLGSIKSGLGAAASVTGASGAVGGLLGGNDVLSSLSPVKFFKELHDANASGVFEHHANPTDNMSSSDASNADGLSDNNASGKDK